MKGRHQTAKEQKHQPSEPQPATQPVNPKPLKRAMCFGVIQAEGTRQFIPIRVFIDGDEYRWEPTSAPQYLEHAYREAAEALEEYGLAHGQYRYGKDKGDG